MIVYETTQLKPKMRRSEEMKFKKVLAMTVLTAMMAVSFAGCSKSAESATTGEKEETSKSSDSKESVTLTVWGDSTNQAILEAPFKAINEAFEKAHPDIKIDYQWTATFDTINIAVQSDTLPDLFWIQGNKSTKMAELAKNGYIMNLDQYNLDASRYPDSAIQYAKVDGSVYCNYPGFFDYVTLYYNKQLFEENNVKVPTNYNEFETALATFMENGVTPISGSGNGDFERYWMIQLLAPALCGDDLEAIKDHREPAYTSMAQMFDKYQEYAQKQYLGKDFEGTDGSGSQLAFTNGKAAMIIDGTWNNALYRDLDFEVGAFAIPDESGTRYGQSGESNFTTFAVASKTQYPDQAAEYLKFLSSLEAEQIIEDHTGSIPLAEGIEPKDDLIRQFADVDAIGPNIYHILAGVADDTAMPQDILIGEVGPKVIVAEIDGKQAAELIKNEIAKSSLK